MVVVMVGGGGAFYGLRSYSSSTSTPLSCLHKTGTDDKTEEEREMPEEILEPAAEGAPDWYPALLFHGPWHLLVLNIKDKFLSEDCRLLSLVANLL